MTQQEVLDLLEAHKNERGVLAWEKVGSKDMKSFGLGITQLKKLAKQVGRDHDLALQLWASEYVDARQLATMIDEPARITREQVERQVGDMKGWQFFHVYFTNLMPKVSFQQTLFEEWIQEKNEKRYRSAYLMLYNLAKNNKKLEDSFFEPYVTKIEKEIGSASNFTKDAMNNALWIIGQRSQNLNIKALDAARKIGKVVVDYGDNSCEALDVVKHLSGPRIQAKVQGK